MNMGSKFKRIYVIETDSEDSNSSSDDSEKSDVESYFAQSNGECSSDSESNISSSNDDNLHQENLSNEVEEINDTIPLQYKDFLKDDSFEDFVKDKNNGITSTPQTDKNSDDSEIGEDRNSFNNQSHVDKVLTDSSEHKVEFSSNGISPLFSEKLQKSNFTVENGSRIIIDSSTNQSEIAEISSAVSSDRSIIDDSVTRVSPINFIPQRMVGESSEEDVSSEVPTGSVGSDSSDVQFITSVNKSSLKNFGNINSVTAISDNSVSIASNSNSKVGTCNIDDSMDKRNSRNSSLQVSGGSSLSEPFFSARSVSSDTTTSSHKSSQSFESHRRTLEGQIADKTAAYQNLMRALSGCDTRKLKDGGKLLEEKMLKCKEELQALKDKLKEISDGSSSPDVTTSRAKLNSLLSTKDQVTENLGKKGLETHRVQTALTVDTLVRIHESLSSCPSEKTYEKDPEGLRVELMPHQKHALAWLLWREKQIPAGGILADDMGLGKTLSMISLMLRSEEYKKESEEEEDELAVQIINGKNTYKGKTLVVCPASLLGQWEGQIKQHCKRNCLAVVVHHGKTREYQAKKIAVYDVVITTYGMLAEEYKCKDQKKAILFRVRWERVILDEAHIIRNVKTQKALAACDLIATFRWCLTGTPVHNRELDMYSLLKFLRCSPFDDRVVWKRWVDNKSSNGVQRLKTVVKSIMLRRTKDDLREQGQLKELPDKETVPIYIELDKDELKVYQKVLHFSKSLLAEYLHQKQMHVGAGHERIESVRRQLNAVEDIKTTEIFVLLLRLRQICCLPGLIHGFLEKETCIESGIEPENPVIEDLYSQLSRLSIGDRNVNNSVPSFDNDEKNVLVKSNPVFEMNRRSSKIETLLKIIKDILTTEDKIVIVSQWTNLLKKLEPHIRSLKVEMVTLDGSVPVKFRSKLIDDFNCPRNSVRIMLLSLNAGGVGLNLVGGNRLIIFEPHWNPQLESQACDRVYRVGQKKKVFIYKIICKNTIEERIELLQRKKLELAQNILQGVTPAYKSQVSQLSLPDLITLFDIATFK